MVTDVVGTVKPNVALFAMLEPGRQLKLDNGARLELAFVNGGTIATCVGPCAVTVKPDGLEGTGFTVKRPTASAPGVAPTGVNWDHMAGVRRPGPDDPALVGDEVRLEPPSLLVWTTGKRVFDEVEVVVEEGTQRVAKALVPGTAKSIPVQLQAGHTYRVTLSCFAGNERVTPEPSFTVTVLSTEEAAAFRAAETAARTPGQLTLLLDRALQLRLYGKAREIAQRLAAERPQDPGVAEILRRLP